jgi:hypothetical protein
MALYWATRNAMKKGTILRRQGIRFAAPNIITKGAKKIAKVRNTN